MYHAFVVIFIYIMMMTMMMITINASRQIEYSLTMIFFHDLSAGMPAWTTEPCNSFMFHSRFYTLSRKSGVWPFLSNPAPAEVLPRFQHGRHFISTIYR